MTSEPCPTAPGLRSNLPAPLALALLLACVLLIATPRAWAGEWTQVTCTQPDGQAAPIEGWQGAVNRPGNLGGPIA